MNENKNTHDTEAEKSPDGVISAGIDKSATQTARAVSGDGGENPDVPIEVLLLEKLIKNASRVKFALSKTILPALLLLVFLPAAHSFSLVARIGELRAASARPIAELRELRPGLPGINGGQGMEVLPNGTVVIADTNNRRVVAFARGASAPGELWSLPEGQEPMVLPYDVAGGPDGSAYVLDTGTGKIHVFSPEGKYLRTLDLVAPGGRGLVVDRLGNAYVADTGQQSVRKALANGRPDPSFGGPAAPGAIRTGLEMNGIAALDDSIYVTARDAIYKIDSGGHQMVRLQTRGVNYGIAAGPDGNLYTTDIATDRVWAVTPEGKMVAWIGGRDASVRLFGQPRGLAFDGDGRLWVMNNDHVAGYEISGVNR